MKFARIFANDKGIWRIYIYDINVEKNGVTDTPNIKNISHTGLENLLADAVKYLNRSA